MAKEKKPKKGKFVIGITLKQKEGNELKEDSQPEPSAKPRKEKPVEIKHCVCPEPSAKPRKEKPVEIKHCVCPEPNFVYLGVSVRNLPIRHCKDCGKFLLQEQEFHHEEHQKEPNSNPPND